MSGTGAGPASRRPGREGTLVDALRSGDAEAFAALVDRWSGSMLRVARRHVRTDSHAEEVVQETWLAVLEGLPGFRGQSSLRTWVFRILVNQAKRRGVREHRTVPFSSIGEEMQGAPALPPSRFQGSDEPYPGGWREPPEPWPEQVVLSRELLAVVRAALATLPERQRTVVTLRDLHGSSSEEVGGLLGISAGNQRVLLHRGRGVVRSHLERYFAAAPAERVGGP